MNFKTFCYSDGKYRYYQEFSKFSHGIILNLTVFALEEIQTGFKQTNQNVWISWYKICIRKNANIGAK